ncbi:MAG: zinc dependent phospholipase C family protein [Bacteroides sp.]|nr:zinc dependent phospholipase C family protein [Eubacterium sp.]MCM1418644.1 zinc dependent phospholipase C family protein [Roseburia sp.]MCM1462698.1 zinc dependent phospholipase C family protein [Bacteroides sp.]
MPAAYAHLKFGEEVLDLLPAPLSDRLRSEGALFRLGLIGPDFLFFYRPAVPNIVLALGRRIHADAGLRFFAHGASVLRSRRFSDDAFAYLCGVLCHFVLDSACHGFISSVIERFGVGHIELENAFDRSLMRCDGKDPDQCPLGAFRLSRAQSELIAAFYRGVSPKKLRRAVSSAAFYGTLFSGARTIAGRRLCGAAFPTLRRRRVRVLEKGEAGLMKRYRRALGVAARLIAQLEENARRKKPWSEAYSYSFAGKRVL